MDSPVDFVNPLIGTDSSFELSNGNTYPAIARPWGMNFWTPQTGNMGNGWAYTYESDKMWVLNRLINLAHGLMIMVLFSLMPNVGEIKVLEDQRKQSFKHNNEVVQPYYYSVLLHEISTKIELTTSERSAYFRFTFPEVSNANIIIDAFDKGSQIRVIPDQKKLLELQKIILVECQKILLIILLLNLIHHSSPMGHGITQKCLI